MVPLTLLAAQKVVNVLTTANALAIEFASVAPSALMPIPAIDNSQIVLSSVAPDLADKDIQFTYPRICVYSGVVKNAQTEKFRSFSGTVGVQADIWASADMVTQTDLWVHYYLEAATGVLRKNIGDWGDGIFFGGKYDVKLQAAKPGGFGFVQAAVLTCSLNVSLV